MPQAGIDPPRQSHATYEASALPPSYHGWIKIIMVYLWKVNVEFAITLNKNSFG